MVKIIKIPSGFELMTYRSVFKVFYFISRKKKFIKIIKMGGMKRVIYKKKMSQCLNMLTYLVIVCFNYHKNPVS